MNYDATTVTTHELIYYGFLYYHVFCIFSESDVRKLLLHVTPSRQNLERLGRKNDVIIDVHEK